MNKEMKSKYSGKTYNVNIRFLHPIHGCPPMNSLQMEVMESYIKRKELEEQKEKEN